MIARPPAVALNIDANIDADLAGRIARFVVEQRLRPGDRLPSIRELSVRLGVKPGAIRVGLSEAQRRGLVRVLPRAGVFVDAPGAVPPLVEPGLRGLGHGLGRAIATRTPNAFHLLEARQTIEVATVAAAARRRSLEDLCSLREILEEMASLPSADRGERYVQLDFAFHLEIARLAGNTVLEAMLEVVLRQLTSLLQGLTWSPRRHAATDRSHARLYAALVAGEAEQGQQEIRGHLRHAYQALLNRLRLPPVLQSGPDRPVAMTVEGVSPA